VHIGPFSVVEEGVSIGDGAVVLAGSYIGRGCSLGKSCIIGPHAVLYAGVHLGDRVRVHAGSVVGSDGFGYVMDEDSGEYFKIPQLGTVIVEDDVEIGSNTSIDRATFGATKIGRDTKVDNLIQIAHNVQIGEHCTLSGQAGIAGSSTVGDYCVLAGQVGIADHVVLEDRVIVGAQAGVPSRKRIKGNQIIWGSPARPLAEAMRMFSTLSRLAKEKGKGKEKKE
jgi:UDP-3-O-[3-hydroxymyristoyl] glucosamine N-acyltransferase